MRGRRRTPAGGVRAEKQQRYLQLIAQGVNNSEACRQVGVDRKTGNRWRYGRKVRNSAGAVVIYAPVKIKDVRPRSPRYLSEHERIRIADLLAAKMTIRAIAVELGRAASTISREIRRNRDPDGRYRPHHAEQSARLRACKPRQRRLATDGVLAQTVSDLLGKRWSPEQVAHELREVFAGERSRWLCRETIYQAIYDPAVQITRPARRRRRRRRLTGLQRRGRLTAMRMIDERPAEVEDRVQAGHWEGDLIMGAHNRSAIGTLVERTTRFVILFAFHDGVASADGARQAITQALGYLPQTLRRTLTWDQGKELAMHQQITASTGADVFFCDAHSPWQRASNENMNGLLRDYFPKATDLSIHTAQDLARVAAEVNDRPRKTLGWRRPAELLNAEISMTAPERDARRAADRLGPPGLHLPAARACPVLQSRR
jgi:IS30 family transposase